MSNLRKVLTGLAILLVWMVINIVLNVTGHELDGTVYNTCGAALVLVIYELLTKTKEAK